MSFLINDIADYLEDAGHGTVGTNIFVSYMPLDKTGLAIFDTGSYANDDYLPIAHQTFQVYIRADSYDTARNLADNVIAELQQFNHQPLVTGGIEPYIILLIGEPNHLGRDEKNRDEITINFRAKYAR